MDLNVIIETCGDNTAPRDSDTIVKNKLNRCRMLGFTTVALSVIVDLSEANANIPPPPDVKALSLDQGPNSLKVYSRLTVKVSEPGQLYKVAKNKETSNYDLLALEPQNAHIFQHITTGNAELDIFTLDLSERIDYGYFKNKFTELEKRGVCIEINYGPAQQGQGLRRNVICNGQNLVEKTTKNIILSNGTRDAFRLRGPKDAQSIGTLFFMPVNKCHDAVYKNGKKALDMAKRRANPTSCAIEKVIL